MSTLEGNQNFDPHNESAVSEFQHSLMDTLTKNYNIDFSNEDTVTQLSTLLQGYPAIEVAITSLKDILEDIGDKEDITRQTETLAGIYSIIAECLSNPSSEAIKDLLIFIDAVNSGEKPSIIPERLKRFFQRLGRIGIASVLTMFGVQSVAGAQSTVAMADKTLHGLHADSGRDNHDNAYDIGGGDGGPDPDDDHEGPTVDDGRGDHEHGADIEGNYSCGPSHNAKAYTRCALEEIIMEPITPNNFKFTDDGKTKWEATSDTGRKYSGTYTRATKKIVITMGLDNPPGIVNKKPEPPTATVSKKAETTKLEAGVGDVEIHGNREVVKAFRAMNNDVFCTAYSFPVKKLAGYDQSALIPGTDRKDQYDNKPMKMAVVAQYKLVSISVITEYEKGDYANGKVKLKYKRIGVTPFSKLAVDLGYDKNYDDLAAAPKEFETDRAVFRIQGKDITFGGAFGEEFGKKPDLELGRGYLQGDFSKYIQGPGSTSGTAGAGEQMHADPGYTAEIEQVYREAVPLYKGRWYSDREWRPGRKYEIMMVNTSPNDLSFNVDHMDSRPGTAVSPDGENYLSLVASDGTSYDVDDKGTRLTVTNPKGEVIVYTRNKPGSANTAPQSAIKPEASSAHSIMNVFEQNIVGDWKMEEVGLNLNFVKQKDSTGWKYERTGKTSNGKVATPVFGTMKIATDGQSIIITQGTNTVTYKVTSATPKSIVLQNAGNPSDITTLIRD